MSFFPICWKLQFFFQTVIDEYFSLFPKLIKIIYSSFQTLLRECTCKEWIETCPCNFWQKTCLRDMHNKLLINLYCSPIYSNMPSAILYFVQKMIKIYNERDISAGLKFISISLQKSSKTKGQLFHQCGFLVHVLQWALYFEQCKNDIFKFQLHVHKDVCYTCAKLMMK